MRQHGFTLIEMIVVVTIIAIFTTVGIVTFRDASRQARDTDRQADLKLLKSAVEQYRQKYGRYPEGCKPAGEWSGQIGTQYACADGSSQYIVGLAPEFISALPQEKFLKGTDSGYVYVTNRDNTNTLANDPGTVYKIEAKKTVESETVTEEHPMRSCDVNNPYHTERGQYGGGMCTSVYRSPYNNTPPSHCEFNNPIFEKSYAVWGGYANAVGNDDRAIERETENIICAIP